jgi:hypothetical protein
MQGTVVTMLMILAGLGTHNKESDDVDPPPAPNVSAIQGDADPVTAPVYPPSGAGAYGAGYNPSHSVGRVVHQTIVSFFLGHDDDVMTEKEIESAMHAGAYSGLDDYPPSAVLSFEGPR